MLSPNLSPARTEKEARQRIEAVELCGRNRGPHNYIPIEWSKNETAERVTRLLCTTCFGHISVKMIIENYPDIKL